MDQLAKQVAEMALRLAALPAESLRQNEPALATIEQLALGILKEVAVARAANAAAAAAVAAKPRSIGETTGCWRVAVPIPRH